MRIVAGKYGSRSLKSPKNDATRPTQDKIKGAIYSSLGNIFDGGNFLECYTNILHLNLHNFIIRLNDFSGKLCGYVNTYL